MHIVLMLDEDLDDAGLDELISFVQEYGVVESFRGFRNRLWGKKKRTPCDKRTYVL